MRRELIKIAGKLSDGRQLYAYINVSGNTMYQSWELMAIPLNTQTKPLYKKYNLLNITGKVKTVNPRTAKTWLSKLNLSPFHKFKLSHCSDGKWRIFINS